MINIRSLWDCPLDSGTTFATVQSAVADLRCEVTEGSVLGDCIYIQMILSWSLNTRHRSNSGTADPKLLGSIIIIIRLIYELW